MAFFKKKPVAAAYDRSRFRPVIRKSICTGEETACLQDRETGHLQEIALLRSEADRQVFCRAYGDGEEITVIY